MNYKIIKFQIKRIFKNNLMIALLLVGIIFYFLLSFEYSFFINISHSYFRIYLFLIYFVFWSYLLSKDNFIFLINLNIFKVNYILSIFICVLFYISIFSLSSVFIDLFLSKLIWNKVIKFNIMHLIISKINYLIYFQVYFIFFFSFFTKKNAKLLSIIYFSFFTIKQFMTNFEYIYYIEGILKIFSFLDKTIFYAINDVISIENYIIFEYKNFPWFFLFRSVSFSIFFLMLSLIIFIKKFDLSYFKDETK